jgi:ATP-dependent DNA helicase RecQ
MHLLNRGESKGEEHPFRKWFGQIGELRSLLPDPPLLAITATASRSARKKIKEKLAMNNSHDIVENPDRTNIKLFVKSRNSNEELSVTFEWLVTKLTSDQQCERTIVFCKSIKDCAKIYNMLIQELPQSRHTFVQMFHSCTTESVKDKIRIDMEDSAGTVRVLVATNAAGMGVNYKGVTSVLNFGPPQELDTLVQHIGRAGRDGSQSMHLLLYCGRQLRKVDVEVLTYLRNSNTCRRKVLLRAYQAEPIE